VSGSIDRVDRAENGSLHVVDFKTGRTAASAAATAEHPQLGIYQLAIRLGALDVTDPVHLGQAELVHLADRFASGMPKVRIQAPLDDGWTWVNDLIVDAARLADGPDYPARPNGHCKSCAFRFMCPAQSPPASPTVIPGPAAAEPPAETERVSAPATAESAAEERPVPASEPAEPEPAEPAPGDPAPAPGEPADGDAGSSADPATPPSGPARPARPAARKRPANPDAPVQQPLWGEDL
jgi:hypothetical protein